MTQEEFDNLVINKKKPYGEALDEVSKELTEKGIEHKELYDNFNKWLAS